MDIQRSTYAHMTQQLHHQYGLIAKDVLRRLLIHEVDIDHPLTSHGEPGMYLLYFNGGSRGNPDPRRTGAIVLRAATSVVEAQVCWISSMSYPCRSDTNNMAENLGLLHELTACDKHHFKSLAICDDHKTTSAKNATES